MVVYRIRHIPTGLFYCPSRSVKVKLEGQDFGNWVKSNLSEKGKLYSSKPSLKHIYGIYNHTKIEKKLRWSTIGSQSYAYPTFEMFNEADFAIEVVTND